MGHSLPVHGRTMPASTPPHLRPDHKGSIMLAEASLFYLALLLAWGWSEHWSVANGKMALQQGVLTLSLLAPLALRRYRSDPFIVTVLGTTAGLIVFSQLAAAFSYMITSTNAPLFDATLARWDHNLGFDWVDFSNWSARYPLLDLSLQAAYDSLLPQMVLLVLFLAWTGRFRLLSDFCGTLVVCKMMADLVSGFYPAMGASKYYAQLLRTDVSMLSDFEPLRSGALRSIDLVALQGLIVAPSFHAILALLLIVATRGTKLAWPYLLLNLWMLLATPKFGGHYLVDLLAGALTVLLASLLWQRHITSKYA
ncbi:phosphatase PAP2 family protein [Rugamonas aquatica]|uniref:PAP2 family protein n=1 Tax=Rugamonas aquatica TaxID=2743357 RepID=A0A6A7N4D0_9BURK|nr:phosphatase PAP2 family protein [Rugamonas aquatica]MQA39913.1 PAP2 family protein [Rugamonas aquatica]